MIFSGLYPQCAGWLVRCLARVDDLYDSTRDRRRGGEGQKGRHGSGGHEYTAEWPARAQQRR